MTDPAAPAPLVRLRWWVYYRFYDLRHLTWRGRCEVVLYAARRVFVKPAPESSRCLVGAYTPIVRCPRGVPDGELLCAHHERKVGHGG